MATWGPMSLGAWLWEGSYRRNFISMKAAWGVSWKGQRSRLR
jgi:hypothetical protein